MTGAACRAGCGTNSVAANSSGRNVFTRRILYFSGCGLLRIRRLTE